MPLHEAHYQHWEGFRSGIWSRRAVIAANGLRGCLRGKWLRRVLAACWGGALAQVAILFALGQLLVKDSLVARSTNNFDPQLRGFLQGLVGWLEQHPEISVRVTQDFLFYQLSGYLTVFTMLAIALAVPHLITRDLGSKAILIYSSKAITRWDYVLGKAGTVFGLIGLTWLGPVAFSWFLGNLLAPHWHFFWHSRLALLHAGLYGLCAAVVLSGLALGVSAISPREKITATAWLAIWLVGRVFSSIGNAPREVLAGAPRHWLEHLSTTFNLGQLSASIFRLGDDLQLARENVPLIGNMLRHTNPHVLAAVQSPDVWGAVISLGVMLAIAAALVAWRVKPE